MLYLAVWCCHRPPLELLLRHTAFYYLHVDGLWIVHDRCSVAFVGIHRLPSSVVSLQVVLDCSRIHLLHMLPTWQPYCVLARNTIPLVLLALVPLLVIRRRLGYG